jgi:prophage maintenance system killer protein
MSIQAFLYFNDFSFSVSSKTIEELVFKARHAYELEVWKIFQKGEIGTKFIANI